MVAACGFPDLSPQYSATELGGHAPLYVKREVRGLNYDVWAMSSDPDPCHGPDPETDYVFEGSGPHEFVIGSEGGVTVVYARAPLRPPHRQGVTLKSAVVSPLDWANVADLRASTGFALVDQRTGPVRTCGKR